MLSWVGTGTHIPGWHWCPSARQTAAFVPVLLWLPRLNLRAEKS